jgi:hypothetical protein
LYISNINRTFVSTIKTNNMETIESFKHVIKEFSKQHPTATFNVRCTNYSDNNSYYLKNGTFCKNTCFNTKYDFHYNKVTLSQLPKDAIYKATELENKELYNL